MTSPIITGTRGSIVCSWNADTSTPEWYGASAYKRDDEIEGTMPHAATFYLMLQHGQGSSYSKERTGPLHWENLADARMAASAMRAAEKLHKNSLPLSADEGLRNWTQVLNVTVSVSDTDEDIREHCSAKYKGFSGNSYVEVQRTLMGLLGTALSEVKRFVGVDFDTPPPVTEWLATGGSTYFALGHDYNNSSGATAGDWRSGPWHSARARLLIEIVRGALSNRIERHRLDVVMRETLDRLLPAWVTFDWVFATDFILDVSQLDVSALSPPEEE